MRRLYGLGLLEAKRPQKWPRFFYIDLAPAIFLRFSRIALQAVSWRAIILIREVCEWPWHRDTTSPMGTMVLTISTISVPHTTLHSFFQGFVRVIALEVTNLLIPEDRKMNQINILHAGVKYFMWWMYAWGIFILACITLTVVGRRVKDRLRIYRSRRRSQLPSPIGDVASV